MTASRLYRGEVAHVRHRPRGHRLRYRIFQLLLDLDELEALDARLRLFSVGGFNLVSFHPADHPSRDQVLGHLKDAGIGAPIGAIRLLCMPRVLGHAFNPLSLFFCHRPDGGLAAIVYEVNNTFGERHLYVLPVAETDAHAERLRQTCDKAFFVSPFMPMELTYRFEVVRRGEKLAVRIEAADGEGPLLFASFEGRGRRLTDAALLRAFAGAPLLSLKVLAAIHWEALRLWLKGLKASGPPVLHDRTVGQAPP